MVHLTRLGEGERLAHEARKPLLEGVDPALNVASLAFFLASGLVLLFGDHFLISLPEVAVAGHLLVSPRDRPPQTLTGRPAPVASDEGHHSASLPAQG